MEFNIYTFRSKYLPSVPPLLLKFYYDNLTIRYIDYLDKILSEKIDIWQPGGYLLYSATIFQKIYNILLNSRNNIIKRYI